MDYVVKFPKGVVKLLTLILLTHNNITSNTAGQDYFRAPNIMDPMRTMVDPYSMANG